MNRTLHLTFYRVYGLGRLCSIISNRETSKSGYSDLTCFGHIENIVQDKGRIGFRTVHGKLGGRFDFGTGFSAMSAKLLGVGQFLFNQPGFEAVESEFLPSRPRLLPGSGKLADRQIQ